VSPAEVLRKAAAKVRQGWTQRVSARNALGECVSHASPNAVCWCADGALSVVAPISATDAYVAAIDALGLEIGQRDFVSWNDAPHRTAEEVASAMERAALTLDGAS
jgi:hypothetical protein